MARKVFVSYKYMDNDVQALATTQTPPTWPCDERVFVRREDLAKAMEIAEELFGEDLDR